MLTRGLDAKRLIGIGTSLVFVLAACGDDGDDGDTESGGTTDDQEEEEETSTEATPTLFGEGCSEGGSYVAQGKPDEMDQIAVYDEPDGSELHSFDTLWTSAKELENPEDGTPIVFLLTEDSDPAADWLHVALPLPIPDSDVEEAYIQASDVVGYCHDWEITVDPDAFTLTLTESGEERMSADVGLGADERATEPGEYFTTEVINPIEQEGAYGQYAWAINGFSEDPAVIEDFADNELGLAVVGIHGTNEPDLIPGDVSNGCIRLKNEDIARFSEEFELPWGVPVHVL